MARGHLEDEVGAVTDAEVAAAVVQQLPRRLKGAHVRVLPSRAHTHGVEQVPVGLGGPQKAASEVPGHEKAPELLGPGLRNTQRLASELLVHPHLAALLLQVVKGQGGGADANHLHLAQHQAQVPVCTLHQPPHRGIVDLHRNVT